MKRKSIVFRKTVRRYPLGDLVEYYLASGARCSTLTVPVQDFEDVPYLRGDIALRLLEMRRELREGRDWNLRGGG